MNAKFIQNPLGFMSRRALVGTAFPQARVRGLAQVVGLCCVLGGVWMEAADRDQWHLEYRPSQHIVFTSSAKCKGVGDAIEYWAIAPVAPELIEQRQVRTTFLVEGVTYPVQTGTEFSSYHRPVLLARIPPRAQQRPFMTFSVRYEARLFSRYLRPGPTTNPPPALSRLERTAALSDSDGFGYKTAAFSGWLNENGLRRKPDETAITFGRRACRLLVEHMSSPSAPGESVPIWDEPLESVCRNLSGDCGRHARMYVGLLRANGIPARSLVGFWVDTKKGICREGNHVRTEFFAEGVGWVPVDTQWPEDVAVGVDHGNFIVFHVYAEEPLGLPTPNSGSQSVGCLMGIFARSAAEPLRNPILDGWHIALRAP